MKTIKQIADELGVSKTAVRKKITEEVKTKFSETIGNTVYISEQGEKLIKSAFSQHNENKVSDNQTEMVSTLVSILQNELALKNKLINEQQQTINELTIAIKAQAQSINADRHNEFAETIQLAIRETLTANNEQPPVDDNSTIDNLNWLKKIFKRK